MLKFSEYNFSEATSAEIKKRFPSNKSLKKPPPHNTVQKLFWKLSAIQMIDTYLSWKSDQSLFLQGQAKARLSIVAGSTSLAWVNVSRMSPKLVLT